MLRKVHVIGLHVRLFRLVAVLLACVGCTTAPAASVVLPTAEPRAASTATQAEFDGARAYASVVDQVALGPRISGSIQNWQLGNRILEQLSAYGWVTQTQTFMYQHTLIRNITGIKGNGHDVVILGAHYDTRRRADQDPTAPDLPVPGADDGGSGVAVLLELARVLDVSQMSKQVWLVFFDAEDDGELDGWDWLVGSHYYASHLTIAPFAVVVVDMVGDQQQDLYLEQNSNQELADQIWNQAQQLGYGQQFIHKLKWSMLDDQSPFLERGWRAVDIIDFDYPYWHTTADTPDKISPQSLERVGRTLQAWLTGLK